MYHSTLVMLLVTAGLLISSCNTRTEVTEQNVSRIIQTLSSDEMKGRHAFENEIEDAADFIANEFKQIGLSPLPGNTDFRQNFSLYSIKPAETTVSINNEELDSKYYFGMAKTEQINWETGDTDLKYISKEDTYREKFQEFTEDSKSSVIVVSKAHSKWFHRYRSYYTRSNFAFELDMQPNDVFVLYDKRIQNMSIHLKNDIETIDLFNVAGMIEGEKTDEIVLFSAHYDHIGVMSPVRGDSIANGANDNASGVAGVIELARYFENRSKPQRTLYFVGFTAEEVGGYGSRYFCKQLNPNEIVAMINLEMIGKPAIEGPNTAWITGFEYSSLGEILQNNIQDSDFEFYPDPYPNQNLFYRSDNVTLARLGVPAHSISTTPIDIDQDYHRVTDEFNTLHIPHTTNTIQAVATAVEAIVSGEKTPTRIPIESVN
ncbi:MAG: M20/M25/M40 family metallo-hydrolase [Gracilimonas sp.]|uniref:M28 family metallopeptidase n=1 Tax=Gracilimonas sp. TaxID=1974203 RepID=UPI0019C68512|nr:M20/M25/M40 family metallo-hydrolase [Gracilimonas sp.]MBD3615198.1 M20/M25/M40 family metallo-hydrolase [Gracilimonas sp.]